MNQGRVVVEGTLLSRHSPSTRMSHFDGTEEQLKERVLLYWNTRWGQRGREDDTFVLSVDPRGFKCMAGAIRTLYEVVKPDAAYAEVVVRVHRRNDELEYIEIVDLKAWPAPPLIKKNGVALPRFPERKHLSEVKELRVSA